MNRNLLTVLALLTLVLGFAAISDATSGALSTFNTRYPGKSYSCSLCHTSAPATNPYGAALTLTVTAAKLAAIENVDSDGDGFTNIQEINAGTLPGSASSRPAPVTCTSFTYSAWSACSANGQQTRTVTGSSPAGCTGGSPVLSQACTPPPAACTGYTYSAWSACGSNGQQTRTVLSNTPAGCAGTPATAPVLSQGCTPPPVACTSFTYSAWGACNATTRTQTRTVATSSPAGCTGGSPVLSQACTPPPAACTGYTYSAWSACGSNGQQTRTVLSNTPAGCAGTPATAPVLSQGCTPPPVACTSFTYSAWSACSASGQQTRTVTGSSPAGCTGGSPVLSQGCTYVPPTVACTGYTYSAWSACGSNGQQTRTVLNNTPAGCAGTPATAPSLTQSCTYVPPPTTSDATAPTITSFELPATYYGLTVPVLSFTATDNVGVKGYKITTRSRKPSATQRGWRTAVPTSVRFEERGIKTVYAWAKDAAGNVSLSAKAVVRIMSRRDSDDDGDDDAELEEPSRQQVFGSNLKAAPLRSGDLSRVVPASLGAISADGSSIELLVSIGKFRGGVDVYVSLYSPSSDGMTPATLYNLNAAGVFEEAVDTVLPWKTNVTDINESIDAGLPAAGLPAGAYILSIGVTPSGSKEHYYQWYTPFTIQ